MGQKIIDTLLNAINDGSDNPFPHFALAMEYQKINDRQSAKVHFQHLIQYFPDYSGTYYHFAKFLFEESEHNEAFIIIKKGLIVLSHSNETNLYNELAALRDQYI